MDKVPPNHLQQAHEDKKSTSIQKESEGEISIMGASSTESSPPLSFLSSSNDRAATRFTTNAATTILSTGVHSIPQNNITIQQAQIEIETESRNKRSISTSSIGERKKIRYENTSTSPNLVPSLKNAQDFAHEFLDSDTSLSSSEEEVETSFKVGIHEKISTSAQLYAGAKSLGAPVGVPASGTVEINLEKSKNRIIPQEQSLENTPPRGIKEEETQNNRSDLNLPIKGWTNIPYANGIPSRHSSSSQSPIMSSLNASSSTSRKIDNYTNIAIGQNPSNPVVMQVVSSINALSPPITIVPNRARGGKSSASDQAIGRWTRQEHEAFLVGLEEFGREWKKVSRKIPTRTSAQIRSHAQKYFAKIARDEQQHAASMAVSSQLTGLTPIPRDDANTDGVVCHSSDSTPHNLSAAMLDRFDKILKDPDTVRREVEETLCRLRNRYSELQRTIELKQQQPALERGNSIDRNSNTTHSLHPSPMFGCSGSGHGNSSNLGQSLNSNNHPSPPLSRPVTTVPVELPQNHVIEATKEDRVVESEADIRRFINSDQGALARKELIALHVLGDTLHQNASQENILEGNRSTGRRVPTSNTTTQITVTGTETSVEMNENHSLESTQESDSTTGSCERNIDPSNQHN